MLPCSGSPNGHPAPRSTQNRDAAKQIDNKLNKYRSYYPDFSPARHWAMAALELAFENISMKDRNDTAPYQEKLQELTKELEKQISNRE